MALLNPDTWAADVAENVRASLAAAEISAGEGTAPLFGSVGVFEDVGDFARVAGGLTGYAAGIIAKPAERGFPGDNAEGYTQRLAVEVAVKLKATRNPGQDQQAATAEMANLADLVRQALAADIGRGGLARAITWGGSFMPATDLRGNPRLASPRAGQAFFVATVPVAVARWLPAT